MTLHSALDDFKRTRGDPRRFPGERRTAQGLFSGFDGRLVHVAPDGSIRDFSEPLSGMGGIERSRFGFEVGEAVEWFGDGGRGTGDDAAGEFDGEPQRYVDGTAVVETVHAVEGEVVRQFDVTLGRRHLTHVRLEGLPAGDSGGTPTLHACLEFAPNGRSDRVGQLHYDDAVEVFRDRERAVVTASTSMSASGARPERFEEIIADEPVAFPRSATAGRYEEGRLSPVLRASVDLAGDPPSATVVSVLAGPEEDRPATFRRAHEAADWHATAEAVLEAGRERGSARLPTSGRPPEADATSRSRTPTAGGDIADLRALWLLRAPTGARIAGPEFDPYYQYSGGYGYTWFRDDAEIARYLLAADRNADLGLDEWHADSARFYAEAQLPDGTWPHRVWARNGRLAPGWAHGRIEDGSASVPDTGIDTGGGDAGGEDADTVDDPEIDGPEASEVGDGEVRGTPDYQADQTASVATYLATYLRVVDPGDEAIRASLAAAMDGLDASLAEDGLPARCQNLWENMLGRFTHTAATVLEAYTAMARAPLDDTLRERSRERARTVYRALDELWLEDQGRYAMRLDGGELDGRADGATFALTAAHRAYDALEGVDGRRLNRLVSHVESTAEELSRDPDGPVRGLARFEDDPWRRREQNAPKVWTVTTAWGARAALTLSNLSAAHDRADADRFDQLARELQDLVSPGGPLRTAGGYLPEQVFDDGTPDSARPLGWSHAISLATASRLD